MIIKNALQSIILTCLISLGLSAQPANWQVDENEFEYTMTMVAFLNVNATNLSSTSSQRLLPELAPLCSWQYEHRYF